MLVTCKICNRKIDKDSCYKVVVKGNNCYYCSQEEYDKREQEKAKNAADKDKVYRLVCQIVGRDKIINTMLWKEKAIWNSVKSDEIIGKYLEENKDHLISLISSIEDKEYPRIRYLSAIIKNNIGDFKPKVEEPVVKVSVDETLYDFVPQARTNKRRSLADLEDDV